MWRVRLCCNPSTAKLSFIVQTALPDISTKTQRPCVVVRVRACMRACVCVCMCACACLSVQQKEQGLDFVKEEPVVWSTAAGGIRRCYASFLQPRLVFSKAEKWTEQPRDPKAPGIIISFIIGRWINRGIPAGRICFETSMRRKRPESKAEFTELGPSDPITTS